MTRLSRYYRGVLLLPALLFLLLCFPVVKARAQKRNAVTSVSIRAVAGLQYDIARFKVKPGEKIRLTFYNTTEMGHNLLITKPGARLAVVKAALQLAEKGPVMNYIPESSQVLWAIPVVSPGEAGSVAFTAPGDPGAYPYVCTYPGHGFVMYGVMYVTTGKMPALENDLNVPKSRRQARITHPAAPGYYILINRPPPFCTVPTWKMPALPPLPLACPTGYPIAGMRLAAGCNMPGKEVLSIIRTCGKENRTRWRG